MDAFFQNPDDFIPYLAIGGGLLVGAIGILSSCISGVMKTEKIERSRREIAAYIAEGSMTPEEGERLLKAGRNILKS